MGLAYSMGISDKKMATHIAGASMSDAIAMEVLGKVYGIGTSNLMDMYQNTKPEDGKRHDIGVLFPGSDIEGLLKDKKDGLLSRYMNQSLDMRQNNGTIRPEQNPPNNRYSYNNGYEANKTDRKNNPHQLYNQKVSGHNTERFSQASEQYLNGNHPSGKDYHSSILRPAVIQPDELEVIADAISSLQRPNERTNTVKVQHYAVANTLYQVIAQEGYLSELGIGYLQLSVDDGKDKQNYWIMVRDKDKKNREVLPDDIITRQLEGLLKRITKKGKVDQKDIAETINSIIGNRVKSENLFIKEMDMKLFKKTLEKLSIKKGEDLVLLLEKEEIKMLRSSRKEIFKSANTRKNQEKNYKKVEDAESNIYTIPAEQYIKRLEDKRKDFTHNVPAKFVTKFPKSMMGGVLGFTYLGENMMGIRDDLYGEEANEVEIHEAIHTDDEYETRVITKWMLDGDTIYH